MDPALCTSPVEFAKAIKDFKTHKQDNSRLPMKKIFGGDLPSSVANLLPIQEQ
jgi:hypothetical protein